MKLCAVLPYDNDADICVSASGRVLLRNRDESMKTLFKNNQMIKHEIRITSDYIIFVIKDTHQMMKYSFKTSLITEIATLPDFFCMETSPDGKFVATGNVEYYLHEIESGKEIHSESFVDYFITVIAFSLDGSRIFLGFNDDWEGNSCLECQSLDNDKIVKSQMVDQQIGFLSVSSTAVLAGFDDIIILFGIDNLKPIRTINSNDATKGNFLPNEKMFISVFKDIKLALWDASTGDKIKEYDTDNTELLAFPHISSSGRYVTSFTYESGKLLKLDLAKTYTCLLASFFYYFDNHDLHSVLREKELHDRIVRVLLL